MEYTGDALRELAPEAEKADVILGLENTISAEDNVRIMDRARSKNVLVYYDVGNSTHAGFDVVKEIRWLGKDRICQIHLKDNPNFMGEGKIQFVPIMAAIRDIGFKRLRRAGNRLQVGRHPGRRHAQEPGLHPGTVRCRVTRAGELLGSDDLLTEWAWAAPAGSASAHSLLHGVIGGHLEERRIRLAAVDIGQFHVMVPIRGSVTVVFRGTFKSSDIQVSRTV